jgi:hypothetical protein
MGKLIEQGESDEVSPPGPAQSEELHVDTRQRAALVAGS